MTGLLKGRSCGWCGKPGGTAMSQLKAWADRVGVTLQGKSPRYFHPGPCVEKTRQACIKAEKSAAAIQAPVRYR